MQPALLGKKIGMTQVYDDNGVLHPVTVVQAGPCKVLQVKTEETDGYNAVQLGFGDVKCHRATQPIIGHCGKVGAGPLAYIREIRCEEMPQKEAGQDMTVDCFEGVEVVDVVGTTKGKGMAGVMKRHNFGGQLASHGVKRKHRSPGSINGHATNLGTGPKIKKGKRMAGRMGGGKQTTRKHRLVKIDKDNNLLLIKGSVPGPNGGWVTVRKSKTARVKA